MEEITDLIQCSICLETFTDPRMLPCTHTFCMKCLERIALKMDEQQSKGKLHCPLCRLEFAIPQHGVEGFQKNVFMLRLKEITTMTKPMEKSCDICLESKEREGDEVLTADVYCMQCHKNICRRCSKAHQIIAELRGHQLIPLGAEITENMIKTMSHQVCSQHETEQAKMYCNECMEIICMVCFAENHQNHKCSGVNKVGDIFGQELKEVLNDVETCLNARSRKIQQCTDEKTKFQKNVENIEHAVISRKHELIALIDKCVQTLLEELASKRQSRLKEIQNEIEENERQVVIIESFKTYCKQIETKGTKIELCQIVPTLQRRSKEIQEVHRTLCKQSAEFVELNFEQTDLEEVLKTQNVVGRIKVVSDSIRSSGKLDIPPSSFAFGVTKLEKKVCVLCREPNVIRIFHDQDSFALQMQIELKQINNPYDMAYCDKSKCLYIKDEFNCIWKVTIDNHRVTKWLTGVGEGCARLSVTSEGHLILMTDSPPPKLEIYNSDAELVHHFPLPRNMCKPNHVIRKLNGEFIISHMEGTPLGPWAISRLTSDGQTVIGHFNPKDKPQELNDPRHLALDSDNYRLFVADSMNDRVLLLDSVSLNLMKILLTKSVNGITTPTRLLYDQKKNQLIVKQWPNKVDIYEVA